MPWVAAVCLLWLLDLMQVGYPGPWCNNRCADALNGVCEDGGLGTARHLAFLIEQIPIPATVLHSI